MVPFNPKPFCISQYWVVSDQKRGLVCSCHWWENHFLEIRLVYRELHSPECSIATHFMTPPSCQWSTLSSPPSAQKMHLPSLHPPYLAVLLLTLEFQTGVFEVRREIRSSFGWRLVLIAFVGQGEQKSGTWWCVKYAQRMLQIDILLSPRSRFYRLWAQKLTGLVLLRNV